MTASEGPVTVAVWVPGPAEPAVSKRLARLLLGPDEASDD
jgi:hypothetical protein